MVTSREGKQGSSGTERRVLRVAVVPEEGVARVNKVNSIRGTNVLALFSERGD